MTAKSAEKDIEGFLYANDLRLLTALIDYFGDDFDGYALAVKLKGDNVQATATGSFVQCRELFLRGAGIYDHAILVDKERRQVESAGGEVPSHFKKEPQP